MIKVRWEVRRPDGTVARLQVPFHDVVHVTGQTVIDAIRCHTAKVYISPSLALLFMIREIKPEPLYSLTPRLVNSPRATALSKSRSLSLSPSYPQPGPAPMSLVHQLHEVLRLVTSRMHTGEPSLPMTPSTSHFASLYFKDSAFSTLQSDA